MNDDSSKTIISILSGRGFDVLAYPEKPMDIRSPGFYFNPFTSTIEHWSLPCAYTEVYARFIPVQNPHHLIMDGHLSIIDFDDIDQLVEKLNLWKTHLIKYGVI